MSSANNPHLSIVIPAYNEEKRIGGTLVAVSRFLNTKDLEYEIIVVDDSSVDRTVAVVEELRSQIAGLKLIKSPRNEGKGWAIRSGMLRALGDYRLFMDADNATTIDHWTAAEDAFRQGFDVVVGSRHVTGARIEVKQMPFREILGKTFRLIVRIMFDLGVADTQNGFKAFTSEAAELIFPKQTVKGWAFDVEIIVIAKKFGLKIIEIPVKWVNDDKSRMSVVSSPLILLDLFRIKFMFDNKE